MLNGMSIDTGVNLDELVAISVRLTEKLGKERINSRTARAIIASGRGAISCQMRH
jgi:hypothetical protein